jgi:glycosyltransferase involved in cell wall biosynthesis
MLVSIITVCFNSEKTISKTIESVVNQSYSDIEYIIVDGASSDNTLSIIKFYMDKYPNIIKLLSEKDSGIYNAMNKGINQANGQLLGIINSDDWYELNAVEIAVDYFNKFGLAVFHGFQRTYIGMDEKNIICTNSSQLRYGMIEHPTCFIPLELYKKFGVFNEKYRYAADYELALRLKTNNIPFIIMDSVISNFREGGASHTRDASLEVYKIWHELKYISYIQYLFNYIGFSFKFFILKKIR